MIDAHNSPTCKWQPHQRLRVGGHDHLLPVYGPQDKLVYSRQQLNQAQGSRQRYQVESERSESECQEDCLHFESALSTQFQLWREREFNRCMYILNNVKV